MHAVRCALCVAFAVVAVGCGDDPAVDTDAGTELDAGPADAGPRPRDAGRIPVDVGPIEYPDAGWIGAEDPIELVESDPPVTGLPAGVTFYEAVPYGEAERQVFDALLPESATPTPAILYFHGGGFVNGSRTDSYNGSASAVHAAVEGGAAWIAVGYRLLQEAGVETEGVRKSIYDARRALQFVRFHADELNVDPERIGVYGSSAGAGTSLWLGFHDETADASDEDLIARESSRPQGVAVIETQATYDVMRWAPDVFEEEYPFVTNTLFLNNDDAVNLLVRFYGLPGELLDDTRALEDALEEPLMLHYRAEFDMLEHFSSDDPPTYLQNMGPNDGPLDPGFDLLHHPLHALALHARAEEAEATLEAKIPAYDVTSAVSGPISFLLEEL